MVPTAIRIRAIVQTLTTYKPDYNGYVSKDAAASYHHERPLLPQRQTVFKSRPQMEKKNNPSRNAL